MNPIAYPDSNNLEEIKRLVDRINRAFIEVEEKANRKTPIVNISSPTSWR